MHRRLGAANSRAVVFEVLEGLYFNFAYKGASWKNTKISTPRKFPAIRYLDRVQIPSNSFSTIMHNNENEFFTIAWPRE